MAAVGRAVADFVAAMGAWLLVMAGWAVSLAVARHSGRVAERRDIDEGRARVRAAMETEVAVTVPIVVPRQREAAER